MVKYGKDTIGGEKNKKKKSGISNFNYNISRNCGCVGLISCQMQNPNCPN